MDQVKQTQIILTEEKQNPLFTPPRDLQRSLSEIIGVVTSGGNAPVTGLDEGANTGGGVEVQAPLTPAILGVKEQRVNILEDGTATIDVVLLVEDIPGVSEYDIRVAKDAGNI